MISARSAREIVLTTGAIAGVLCVLLAVAALALDVRPVVFRSGSMSPAIDTGALAISRSVDASHLSVGDVVTVKNSGGTRVTHRIQDVSYANGKATLVLRGDANKVPDDKVYVVKAADRVVFDVPRLGYAVSFLSGPVGIFGGGLLIGLVAITAISGVRTNGPGGRHRSSFVVVALAIGLCVGGAHGSRQTMAYFTDTATLTSGTFTAGSYPTTPPAPVIVSCARSGNGLRLVWTETLDPTTFEIRYSAAAGVATESFSGTPRSRNTAANLDNKAGEIWIVAITGTTSPDSAHYAFTGNGAARTCTLVP